MRTAKENGMLMISIVIYLLFAFLPFFCFRDWIARQTFVLISTGIIVVWYTWETMQLRKATLSQRELQLRPYLIIDEVKKQQDKVLYHFKNIGHGPAIDIQVTSALIGEGAEELGFTGSFSPDFIPVIQCGEIKYFVWTSKAGNYEMQELILKASKITITYNNIENKKYISGFSSLPPYSTRYRIENILEEG